MTDTPSPKRKRANVAAAAGNFRMIHRLTRDIDWNSEPDISSIIEVARLAAAGLRDLGFEPDKARGL